MAQAQLDACNFYFESGDFKSVHCRLHEHKITCVLNDKVAIVIKGTSKSSYLLLQNGKKCMKLSMDVFDSVCDSKVSVRFLESYLLGNNAV